MWITRGGRLHEIGITLAQFNASSLPGKGYTAVDVTLIDGAPYVSGSAELDAAKRAANRSARDAYIASRKAQANTAMAAILEAAGSSVVGGDAPSSVHNFIFTVALGRAAGTTVVPDSIMTQAQSNAIRTAYATVPAALKAEITSRNADISAWASWPYPEVNPLV